MSAILAAPPGGGGGNRSSVVRMSNGSAGVAAAFADGETVDFTNPVATASAAARANILSSAAGGANRRSVAFAQDPASGALAASTASAASGAARSVRPVSVRAMAAVTANLVTAGSVQRSAAQLASIAGAARAAASIQRVYKGWKVRRAISVREWRKEEGVLGADGTPSVRFVHKRSGRTEWILPPIPFYAPDSDSDEDEEEEEEEEERTEASRPSAMVPPAPVVPVFAPMSPVKAHPFVVPVMVPQSLDPEEIQRRAELQRQREEHAASILERALQTAHGIGDNRLSRIPEWEPTDPGADAMETAAGIEEGDEENEYDDVDDAWSVAEPAEGGYGAGEAAVDHDLYASASGTAAPTTPAADSEWHTAKPALDGLDGSPTKLPSPNGSDTWSAVSSPAAHGLTSSAFSSASLTSYGYHPAAEPSEWPGQQPSQGGDSWGL
jgi:hypothetical protein